MREYSAFQAEFRLTAGRVPLQSREHPPDAAGEQSGSEGVQRHLATVDGDGDLPMQSGAVGRAALSMYNPAGKPGAIAFATGSAIQAGQKKRLVHDEIGQSVQVARAVRPFRRKGRDTGRACIAPCRHGQTVIQIVRFVRISVSDLIFKP